MAISDQIGRLTTLRNNIRTKLIGLGILPAASTSATLSECYSVLSNVTGLGASSYTPTTTTQVIPSGRYLSGPQTINAIPSSYIIPTGTSIITANNTYDIKQYASVSVNVQPALQSKTVTPTQAVQSVTPDAGVYGLSKVTVNAIPSSYIIPTGTVVLSSSGTFDVTSYASADVTVTGGPSGNWLEYKNLGSKSMQYIYHMVDDRSITWLPDHLFQGDNATVGYSQRDPYGFISIENGCSDLRVARMLFHDAHAYRDGIHESLITTISGVDTFNACYMTSALNDTSLNGSDLVFTKLSYISVYRCFNFAQGSYFNNTMRFPALSEIKSAVSLFASPIGTGSVYFPILTDIGSANGFTGWYDFYFDALSCLSGTGTFSGKASGTISIPNLEIISGTSIFFSVGNRTIVNIGTSCSTIRGNGNFTMASFVSDAFIESAFSNLSYISGSSTFASCSLLTKIYFPLLSSISGTFNFNSCTSVKTAIFPFLEGIVSGASDFYGCHSLSLFSAPKASILSGAYMFRYCYNLISLFLLSNSVCTLGNTILSMFGSTPVSNYSTSAGRWASIFVPQSLLASYKAATNWTTISSKIFAYESYFDANGNPL